MSKSITAVYRGPTNDQNTTYKRGDMTEYISKGAGVFDVANLKEGDKLKFVKTHHSMNPSLRDQVGKVGTVRSKTNWKVLIEFPGQLPAEYGRKEDNRWWVRFRYFKFAGNGEQ